MPKQREEWKTYNDIFSKSTINTLITLAQKHLFEHLLGKISMGKEAVVLAATHQVYGVVAIKVYMVNTCNFRKMYEYLVQDFRYDNIPRSRLKIIYKWTEREYKNLEIAHKVSKNVVKPIAFLNNVIIMQFLGRNNKPFPLLKQFKLSNEDARIVYDKVINSYKAIVNNGLVHGDLSEYNILIDTYNKEPFLIDFSQGTVKNSPNYIDLLHRDIEKIYNYFSKYMDIDKEELFKQFNINISI